MIRRAVASAVVLLGFASQSLAQVKLEWKYAEGSSYVFESATNVEQTLVIAGTNTDTVAETRTVTRSTVGQRDPAGQLRVAQAVESLQISMEAMGQSYSFDSAKPDEAGTSQLELLRGVHQALAKQRTTLIYDKANKIHSVESDQSLLDSLEPMIQAMVRNELDPEQLKKTANQAMEQLPSDPVKEGDTWERTEAVGFGAGQVMTFQTTYTYHGTVEEDGRTLHKITSKASSVTFALENSPLPLQLKGSSLEIAESAGTMLFDRDSGQVVKSDETVHITGKLDFELNGQELPSDLDLKMESTTQLRR